MKKIFIYGAGYFGEQVYENIKNNYKILGFIDSDKKKINKKLKKLKIYTPEIIKKADFDMVYISSMWAEDIYKSLIQNKIKKSKLYIFPISRINHKKKKNWIIKVKNLLAIFDKNNINYHLEQSSLLGFKRNNDIYNFGDVDLAVEFNQLNKIKKLLKNNKKFKKIELGILDIEQKGFGKKYVFQLTIDDIIDLLINKKIGNHHYWISGPCILKSHTSYFNNLKSVVNNKIPIKVPVKSDEYLVNLYGKDWIKPPTKWTYDNYENIHSKIKFKNFKVKKI